MKNVVLCCAWSDPWIKTISEVQKSLSVKVTLIVSWRDDAEKFKKAFPSAELLIVEDMWLLASLEEKHFSKAYSVSVADKIIAHLMLKRQISMFFTHDFEISTLLFESLCNFWTDRLSNIDLVISPSIPHRFFDYALYIAARDLKVKLLTFQMLPFGSRVIPLNDFHTMPMKSIERDDSDLSNIVDSEIKKLNLGYQDAIPDYMKKHKQERKAYIITYRAILKVLRNLNWNNIYKFKFPNSYKIMFDSFPRKRKATWSRFFLEQINKYFKLRSIRREHAFLAKTADLNKDFILFALHYQPEETSCPSAGLYCDQLLALRTLSKIIPDNFVIYVKEHAAQFDLHQEGDRGRSKSFYNAISAMGSRVILIDQSIDTFTLINHSKAVSTLTGTIGWEGIVRCKPVITFGRSWYEHHPDNLRLAPNTDANDLKRHILGERQSLESSSNWLQTLLATSVHCKHYKGWLARNDVSSDDSARNLSSVILEQFHGLK